MGFCDIGQCIAIRASGAAMRVFIDALVVIQAAVFAGRNDTNAVLAGLIIIRVAFMTAAATVVCVCFKVVGMNTVWNFGIAAIGVVCFALILAFARAASAGGRVILRMFGAHIVARATVLRIRCKDIGAVCILIGCAKGVLRIRARCLCASAGDTGFAIPTGRVILALAVRAAISAVRQGIDADRGLILADTSDGAGIAAILASPVCAQLADFTGFGRLATGRGRILYAGFFRQVITGDARGCDASFV